MSVNKPELVFQGSGVSPGVVTGQALRLDSHNRVILKIHIDDERLIEEEVLRVQRSIEASKKQLEHLKSRLEEKVGREHSFILDAHLLMLEDKSLLEEIFANIRQHRANAEWAVRQTTGRILDAYDSLADEYIRERRSDIENVVERILFNLSGARPFSWKQLPDDLIIVSHTFNPAFFGVIDLDKVHGLALEAGGRTSHTAILARSMRLPTVMGIRDFLSRISPGDRLLLDGDDGRLIINPSRQRLDAVQKRMEEFRNGAEPALVQVLSSNLTLDGVAISLRANTELPDEVKAARRCGAEGIGLFRSEFLYFGHSQGSPGMEEQLAVYRQLAREMKPHPVAIRTLDLGADKLPAGVAPVGELNPSMGLRGIRLSLMARKTFGIQLEAILRAGGAGNLQMVFPMVSTVEEIREAKAVVEEVRASIPEPSRPPAGSVPLGAMIEVPASVLTLEILAKEVDFLCVGTNDLIQYLLAVDRGNPQVAHLYQPLHPSILHCLLRIAEVAHKLRKPARICGEISSNPFYAVLLLGMGFSELSMNPLSIPAIRKVLQQISLQDCRRITKKAMGFCTAKEVGDYLVHAVSQLIRMDLAPYIKEVTAPGSGAP